MARQDRAATGRNRPPLKTVAAGLIGNVIEWYDWFCYGLLASIFAEQIFPSSVPINAILAAFAAYAVGFFVRPVASIILSPFADRHGRRGLMALSVGLMGAASLLLAVTPTYAAVGILSPVILLVARLLQGISAAGEYQSSASYVIENAPQHRRGFVSGLFNATSGLAILAATVSASLVTGLIPEGPLQSWGWRLPFFFGALLSLFGFYLRRSIPESEVFEEIEDKKEVVHSPVRSVFRRHPLQMLQVAAIQFVGVPYYLWSTFLPTYAHLVGGMELSEALLGNTIGLIVYVLVLPLVGHLSDRHGRKPFLIGGAIGLVVLVYPCILMLTHPSFLVYLAASLIGWLLLSTIEALSPVVGVELLPASVRVSGVGIPYQISTAALAGTAPFVASWFISIDHPSLIAGYVLLVMVIAGGIYLTIPETRDRVLNEAEEPAA